jgi:DNA primase
MTTDKINLDAIDIEQVVAYEGADYKVTNGKSGLQLNIKECPSCKDTNYKLYLNAETGLGKCHRCDTGFNKFKFVKLSRGLVNAGDVMRALEGMSDLVSYRPKLMPVYRQMNKDWVLPQNFKIELEDQLPQYLKDRNVDAKLAKRFDLRVCEHGFYHYQDFEDRDRAVDFSQRIIIPVKDINGDMVTFQGRDISGVSEKRYLFPNMLPGTGRYIYNADYALTNKAKKVVLNEGCFDVFAMTEALESDIKYKDFAACGTFGKHLSISATNVSTDDQLSDLFILNEAGVEEFIILWDGETEAIAAAYQAVVQLNSYGLYSTVAAIGGGLDPAETSHSVLLEAIDQRKKPTNLDLVRMKLK